MPDLSSFTVSVSTYLIFRYHLPLTGPELHPWRSKNIQIRICNTDIYSFCDFFWITFILKIDVNLPSVSNQQNKPEEIEEIARCGSESVTQLFGSITKHHGSGTLCGGGGTLKIPLCLLFLWSLYACLVSPLKFIQEIHAFMLNFC
jgi:hypothetical protein